MVIFLLRTLSSTAGWAVKLLALGQALPVGSCLLALPWAVTAALLVILPELALGQAAAFLGSRLALVRAAVAALGVSFILIIGNSKLRI